MFQARYGDRARADERIKHPIARIRETEHNPIDEIQGKLRGVGRPLQKDHRPIREPHAVQEGCQGTRESIGIGEQACLL